MAGEKIAIVEDEAIVALSLRSRLEAANYAVTGIADCASSALSLVTNTTPDLVLLDIKLKGDQTGIDIAQVIYDRWRIPVIFLTGYPDLAILHSAETADLFGYLVKPIDSITLYGAIKIALQKYQYQQHLEKVIQERTTELEIMSLCLQQETAKSQRLESEIPQALDELHALKSRLVTTISHELRTPLAIVLTSAELIERLGADCSSERRSRYFQKIRDAIQAMTTILTNTLTLEKTNAATLKAQSAPFNLHQLCLEILSTVEPQYRIQSRFFGEPQVNLDAELFRLILTHLLSNALKFSEEDIDLEVRYCEDRVTLIVSDRGLGIPPEEMTLVFEPFYRAKNVSTIAGGGLGLAIVKQCVELHGGTIAAQSELRQGTIMRIELPIDATV
ncbi:ATP-binding protein [Leptolyngbya sp. FACHB-17]|uniref:hybrid sensor histidine kinase/response regulator n=1 Tax=unclassified Leptolyngbya TaxID=2650499 RepID=UPI001681756A|nr:ATP-binding protein [Leptolyngbya sp. FACHB-17]MBD2081527.1 response regulator [Leptolyngbya sp. FACHB-17]